MDFKMKELSVLNCSLPNNYDFSENLVNLSYNMPIEKSISMTKVAGFGIISGILIAIIINFIMSSEYEILKKKVKIKIENENLLQKVSVLLILVLVLPFTLTFLMLAVFYKLICSIIIRRKDKHFAAFLDSFDVFWSLEDDATKSIINVLGVIESNSSQDLVDHIREKLQNIMQNSETEKLFYRRNEEYGFYYWRKCCYIDINQYVRIVDVSNSTELNIAALQEIMSEISYQPLPFNDEGLFQILITNQKVKSNASKKDQYGIIFRIHHALGDGVALIEFLCQTLADEKDSDASFCMPEIYNVNAKRTPADILKMMTKLCEMPICLVDGILREPDKSSLHGPALNGKKYYSWTESDGNLFPMIKEIKERAHDLNVTDILTTALSCGLRDYFLKEVDPAPSDIAVILPIRFSQINNGKSKLENNFTVSILDLPVDGDIKEIRRRFNLLRKSADPLTNHYLLKLCSLLPKDILEPMFNSSQATMVFSNLPGPKSLSVCGGPLRSLVFFVPNKGNTGLGVTALCYGGVLRFAASGDAALVTPEDLNIILEGMVMEIKRLHKVYTEQ